MDQRSGDADLRMVALRRDVEEDQSKVVLDKSVDIQCTVIYRVMIILRKEVFDNQLGREVHRVV